jgi:hypothetical protein
MWLASNFSHTLATARDATPELRLRLRKDADDEKH